jgi:O-acetylhomoserine (thiol)-lyase
VAAVAHSHGVPLVVDNTFATPYLFRPFEFGADIVCYSATKYLAGHGTLIGGLVVEKGGFNWFNGRFPQIETFFNSFKESIGEEELRKTLFTKRLRIVYLTDLGAHLSPMSSFLLLQGMETLSLRMDRHVENARKVASFLDSHPAVREVSHASLPGNPYHKLARKYFLRGPGAILSIRLKGGSDAALHVLKSVQIFDYMVNVGDAKSLIVHPSTSTHFSQLEEERQAAGVFEDGLRLSVGIEDVEDLIADLQQVLNSIPV